MLNISDAGYRQGLVERIANEVVAVPNKDYNIGEGCREMELNGGGKGLGKGEGSSRFLQEWINLS